MQCLGFNVLEFPLLPLCNGANSIKWWIQYTQHLGSCNTYAFPYLYATARLETLFRSMFLWRKAHAKVTTIAETWTKVFVPILQRGVCEGSGKWILFLYNFEKRFKEKKMYLQSSCFICLEWFLGKVVLTAFLIEVWIRVNFDPGLLPVL